MMQEMIIKPIGVIHSPHKQTESTPIQASFARGAKGTVEVYPEYEQGLKDLEGFERIWLLFWFDRASAPKLTVVPYMDKSPRGLFATRAPARPNPIGLSCVKLTKVDRCRLDIEDIDILDGTPLLDIKPYVPRCDAWPVERFGWLEKANRQSNKADERFFHPNRKKEGPK